MSSSALFVLGVVLFALGIAVSIALHEAGHMWTAKAFGMRVRRYFIGFGPKVFSFRRGETEYGLKAIPAGGCLPAVFNAANEEAVAAFVAGGLRFLDLTAVVADTLAAADGWRADPATAADVAAAEEWARAHARECVGVPSGVPAGRRP